jgi:hypothetical protein
MLANGTGVGSDIPANGTKGSTHRRSGTISTRYECRASPPRAQSGSQLWRGSRRHTIQRFHKALPVDADALPIGDFENKEESVNWHIS